MSSRADEKSEARALALARRDRLTGSARQEASQIVQAHCLSLARGQRDNLAQRSKGDPVVALFHPIRSEVDLMPIADRLAQEGWTIALPAVVEGSIEFRRFTPGAPLEKGAFDTQHPGDNEPILTPDLIIAPMAAFDKMGGRIGYGGGYYDRYLAAADQAGHYPVFVGAAFDCQRVERVPTESHDRQLLAVITESGIVRIEPNT